MTLSPRYALPLLLLCLAALVPVVASTVQVRQVDPCSRPDALVELPGPPRARWVVEPKERKEKWKELTKLVE